MSPSLPIRAPFRALPDATESTVRFICVAWNTPLTGNSDVVNWSLAKKKTNLRLTEKDLQRPFSFDLPIRFYERVKGTAVEMGISQKQLVSRAVDDFIEAQRKERRRAALPTTVEQ